jgi:hypothetical protein
LQYLNVPVIFLAFIIQTRKPKVVSVGAVRRRHHLRLIAI